MAAKKPSFPNNLPSKQKALEKREEKTHKDLDGDGERGEPKAHKAKVLGYSKSTQTGTKGTKRGSFNVKRVPGQSDGDGVSVKRANGHSKRDVAPVKGGGSVANVGKASYRV